MSREQGAEHADAERRAQHARGVEQPRGDTRARRWQARHRDVIDRPGIEPEPDAEEHELGFDGRDC